MIRQGRCFSVLFALGIAAILLPEQARANLIPESLSQVGAWRVGAYTTGQTATFDHCALYRIQSEGFGLAIGYTARGVWSMGAEAPDWGLTPGQTYTGSIVVGSGAPFTFTGRAINARVMSFNVAPEVFAQLKTGLQLTATANQRRYTISLDGVEAAAARVRDCVRQYAGRGAAAPPAQASGQAPAAAPSPLVASIQNLLGRLGYDPGPANGIVGLKTNIAISAFQKSLGEPGDGLPSEALRGKLEKAVAERTAAGSVPPPSQQVIAPAAPHAAAQKTAASSGTGFFIGTDTIVTNHHVIAGCSEVHIRKNGAEYGRARLIADSPGDDLAALRSDTPSKSYLKLRAGAPIRPAESVLVFGYPLAGALSSAGSTTLGNVTALTGLRDDSRYIQISAPVQPGNSGGPAIDESGRVMAVVVAKLNALAIARITGDIPQNVNFAIKVSTLASFLEAHNVPYEPDPAAHELSNTQRAERAEAGATMLECWK